MAMLATTVLWALGAVVVKSAIGDTPETFRVFVFNGVRMPVVVAFMFLAIRRSGGEMMLKRKDIPLVATVSFFGMFLHIVTSLVGLSLSSASNMGIVFASAPLMILIISFLAGVEKPTKPLVAGILVGMPGVCAVYWRPDGISFNAGDVMFLVSCLFWALYTVFSKRILARYSYLTGVAWVFLFATLYQMPLFLLQLPHQDWGAISPVNWFYLAIGTFGSYLAANSMFYYALHELGPVRTGVYNNLTPFFIVVLAYVMRGESVTALKAGGLVVIVAGVIITKIPRIGRAAGLGGKGTQAAGTDPAVRTDIHV